MKISRRGTFAGLAALAAALVGGTAARFVRWPHFYPHTPYDDLLNQLDQREPVAALGAEVIRAQPRLNTAQLAARLRAAGPYHARAASDAAKDRVLEVKGWLVPESVALYGALAARMP